MLKIKEDTVELKMPNHEQAYWGLRALKTVALADGALTAQEEGLLEAVQRMHGTNYQMDQMNPINPADLARGLTDSQLRRQLVQGMIVISLIDQEIGSQETDLIEQFAQALDVSIPEVKDLRLLLDKEILQLRIDLVRRFWLKEKVIGIWNTEGIRGIYKMVRGLMGKYEDSALAARYAALEHYPAGSLGRSLWEYWQKNGFALPGQKGGAPEQICFHDCAHVLSGYGTAPGEEVQVACFSAGFQRRDPFTFVLFVLLQFHVGVRMTPITEARTGFFDPEKAMIAVRRGAAMTVDLNNGWDYWPVMGEQVEELRRRYNILPVEAFSPASRQAVGSAA
jgi:tellurite resistance protein